MDRIVFDDLVRQAEAKFRSGDLRGAYNDARYILSQTRSNGRSHYLMSCIASLKGAHSDSLKLCQVAVTLDGPSAEYLGQLAICHFHLGALKDAWASAITAFDDTEVSAEVLEKLGDVFLALADYPRFLAVSRRRQAMEPSNDAILVPHHAISTRVLLHRSQTSSDQYTPAGHGKRGSSDRRGGICP